MNLDTAPNPRRSPHRGALAYARVGVETGVECASAHQLITMLFDAAKAAIEMARLHMARRDIGAKGNAISRAINIVDNGLKASLDPESGGAAGAGLAADLAALYDYINQRLMYANLRNDPALLEEAARLLESVASAWRDIGRPAGAEAPVSSAQGPAPLSIGG
jgi:flagellar protein FliS